MKNYDERNRKNQSKILIIFDKNENVEKIHKMLEKEFKNLEVIEGGDDLSDILVELTRLRKSMEEKNEMYRSILENAKDGILVVQNGIVKFLNTKLAEMWGGKVDEVLETPISKYIHPDEVDRVLRIHRKRINNEDAELMYETRLLRKDGKTAYAEVNATLIKYKGEPATLAIVRDITGRVEAEKKLRDSERKYRDLWENANDILYIHDLNGVLLDGNRMAMEKFGYNKDDAGKVSLADIIDEKDLPKAMELIGRILNGEKVHEIYEFLCKTRDGKRLWVEAKSQPIIKDGKIVAIQGIARDITERKVLEDKLRKSEMEKSIILNSINELIIYYGKDRKIIWANKAAGDSVGMSPEELIGRNCFEIWHNRKEPCSNCPVYACWSSKKYEEGEIQSPDGRIWYIKAYPVFEEEKMMGVVEICEEITDKRRIEEERKLAYDQIEKNIENYAILVDEIRNPLSILLGMIEMNFDGKDREVMIQQIDKIQKLIEKLDKGWLESERVRKFLKKYI